MNVYAAIHTRGVLATDVQLFVDYVLELAEQFAGNTIMIMGDLNMDRFRRSDTTNSKGR